MAGIRWVRRSGPPPSWLPTRITRAGGAWGWPAGRLSVRDGRCGRIHVAAALQLPPVFHTTAQCRDQRAASADVEGPHPRLLPPPPPVCAERSRGRCDVTALWQRCHRTPAAARRCQRNSVPALPPPAGAPPHLPKCFTPRLRLLLTSAAHIHAGTSWQQQVLPSGFQATETSSTSTGRCLRACECHCDSACVYRTRERKIKESEPEREGGIRAMHASAHVHTCTHTHTHTHNLFTYAHAGLNHRSGRTSSTSGLKRRET